MFFFFRGFHYTQIDFDENTFKESDIFDVTTLQILRNTSLHYFKAIKTFDFGICYTICFHAKVSVGSKSYLQTMRKFDLRVFVHSKGDEFWLTNAYPLIEIFSIRIPSITDSNFYLAEFSVKEKQMFFLSKQISPCKFYTGKN